MSSTAEGRAKLSRLARAIRHRFGPLVQAALKLVDDEERGAGKAELGPCWARFTGPLLQQQNASDWTFWYPGPDWGNVLSNL